MYFRIYFVLCIFFSVLKADMPLYNIGWEDRDDSSIMDSTLPMPFTFRTKEPPRPHLKAPQDSMTNDLLNRVSPDSIKASSDVTKSIQQHNAYYTPPKVEVVTRNSKVKRPKGKIEKSKKNSKFIESKRIDSKSGFSISAFWGVNQNLSLKPSLNDDVIFGGKLAIKPINYTLAGLKIGYQAYYTRFKRLGYQINLEAASSFKANSTLYAMLNGLLYFDMIDLKNESFSMSIFAGSGIGVVNIKGFNKEAYEFGVKIDIGLSFRIYKSKINLSIISGVMGITNNYISATPSIGYEYVF